MPLLPDNRPHRAISPTGAFLWALALLAPLFTLSVSCGPSPERKEQDPQPAEAVAQEEEGKVILFFGNSLTAGYGLEEGEDFPALIQARLDSLGLPYRTVNAGVSGETSSGGLGRIEWVMRQPVDIFMLELGGNDGLRGIDPEQTKKNLQGIIDVVRETQPQAEIILAGMQVPPNMGQSYSEAFRKLFPELARENDIELMPFLLQDVGGEPELNQPDGIHPNAKGARIVAENVWEVLKPFLEVRPGD